MGHDISSLTALFFASRAPHGQLPLVQAMGSLVERYRFAGFPTKVEQFDAQKIEFRMGAFKGVGIETLSLYGDGVVILSRASTDLLDEFLEDLLGWMEAELGLKRLETHAINRAYESAVFVRSEKRLLKVLDALQPIQAMLAQGVKSAMGLEVPFEAFGIALATDPSTIPSMKPIPFRVERRVNLAFNTNYYASQAPLRTADHIKVLERLEKLAS